jgi:hypothetical protein
MRKKTPAETFKVIDAQNDIIEVHLLDDME